MNFFENQDQAHRSTQRLLILFVLAVVAMIAALYLATVIIFRFSVAGAALSWWSPNLFWTITFIVLGIIGVGSLFKMSELRHGGQIVATKLGGVLVSPGTRDPQAQLLLNVVEEMAIASGIPVPPVYLLEREPGINAFAAGHTVNDAVIGVTQGCLEQLSRDELQGVIGHEFSHILNGDMRLNIRLMGLLHGILIIYLSGRMLLNFRTRSDRGGFDFMGLAVMLIGSIGLLFGRLIKSAVSRQREFLADASAVQFTRNPQGLSNALQKIGGFSGRSHLRSPQAETASHMFFSNALGRSFSGLMATHPPLEVRIQRLGGSRKGYQHRSPASAPSVDAPLTSSETVLGFHQGNASAPRTLEISPEQVVEQVGTVAPAHLAYAQGLLNQLPTDLKEALKHRRFAAAIVYGLLLDKDIVIREQQLQKLRQTESAEVVTAADEFGDAIAQLDPRIRLPLIDLTVPALRSSSATEWTQFCQQVRQLIDADGQTSLSECVLQLVLERRLQPHFDGVSDPSILYTEFDQIWADCITLLSHLASVGHDTPETSVYALRCGLFQLPGAQKHTVPEQLKPNNFRRLDESLKRLMRATPTLKKALVEACSHTVMLDGTVTFAEAELLRGTVIALGCPIPPFLNAAVR